MPIVVGDNGTQLMATVRDDNGVVDLSTASSIVGTLKRGSGSIITKQFDIVDAQAGTCSAVLTADDLNVPGEYTIQLTVSFAGGTKFSSAGKRFQVAPLLKNNQEWRPEYYQKKG